ncbi:hypothetical protein VSDG_00206 [Cytospora chrysosperma]|uniref:Uncharacterized protein n=1 Tax=Cytospora chrysosperma TaxID=252740 RepID=A0A423WQF9_CYTCH|nr:hypothetical protein VSDG_00206 [Valsa sordida]
MSSQQPYMYSAASFDDARFPRTSFDPKAVTRSSWEPEKLRPKKEGPLVSFNRHPDAHQFRGPRAPFKTFGPNTTWWIKWIRGVQLGLRVLELIAAAGILFLFIVIDNVNELTAWVVRITAGVIVIHSIYGIAHLARPAAARPPGSAAGYQIFSSVYDLAVLPLYSFGALAVHNSSQKWGTLFSDKTLMNYFLPSSYYALIGGGVLHAVSLGISIWLAIKFRQIAQMPPDCNPLEDHLTSRHHKRNKSSVATTATYLTEDEKRLSTPLENRIRSSIAYEALDRPPAIPFHATRSPRSSIGSASDLPPRQYQITPENSPRHSPRNSATPADLKRMSAPPSSSGSGRPPAPPPKSPWRGSYAGVPTHDARDSYPPHAGANGWVPPSSRSHGHHSRPSTGTVPSQQPMVAQAPPNTAAPRAAKFTEAWYATESLVARTQERNGRAMSAAEKAAAKRKTVQGYETLNRRYDLSDSESDYGDGDDENRGYSYRGLMSPDNDEVDENDGDLGSQHPNPLQSNPSLANATGAAEKPGRRPQTSFLRKTSALAEIDLNDGRVSNNTTSTNTNTNNNDRNHGAGADITGGKPAPNYGGLKATMNKRYTWGGPRNRDSSIQLESEFYSKPYGDLKSATPPMIVGTNRQVSSGNDYDLGVAGGSAAANKYFSFGKRNVSGKVAEEGMSVGLVH